ncbi:hypothetical protein [Klebsiella pneumoniae]
MVKKLGRVTYEIRNETGNNQVVHINRLKPEKHLMKTTFFSLKYLVNLIT